MTTLSLAAPAKINWTLEVLGKRPDGYHEVRTIFQTINLYDTLILSPADGLSLTVRGATRGFRRDSRAAPEGNLVYRAARLLQERTGCGRGADIRLHKNIPVAAGLGGGSSDAAAALRGLRELWELPISDDELAGLAASLGSDVPFFLRGLRELWELPISDDELAGLAASLGSDVPFFLRGGAALASGRGEVLRPLPDGPAQHFVLAWPKSGERPPDKTARMYAALRSEHYTDGARTESLAARIRAGQPVRDEDCFNVFEAVLGEVDPTAAALFERAKSLGNAHLCGSGPAVFLLVDTDADPEGARRACHETAKIYGSSSLAMTIRAGEAAG